MLRFLKDWLNMIEPKFLNINSVLSMHKDLIDLHGGSHGIRDMKLLESAINHPLMIYQYEPHSDIDYLAANYMYSIIKNHPFLDGNKRTACGSALGFLKLNNVKISIDINDLYEISIKIAESSIEIEELNAFIAQAMI